MRELSDIIGHHILILDIVYLLLRYQPNHIVKWFCQRIDTTIVEVAAVDHQFAIYIQFIPSDKHRVFIKIDIVIIRGGWNINIPVFFQVVYFYVRVSRDRIPCNRAGRIEPETAIYIAYQLIAGIVKERIFFRNSIAYNKIFFLYAINHFPICRRPVNYLIFLEVNYPVFTAVKLDCHKILTAIVIAVVRSLDIPPRNTPR